MGTLLKDWFTDHTAMLAIIGVFSFVLLTLSLLATPYILARFPEDFFSRPYSEPPRTTLHFLMSVVRTLLGAVLVIVGFLFMFTPGPGLVCVVLGLALCEFRGKHKMLMKLVRMPIVFKSLNWLREKRRKPPFIAPLP